MKVFLLTCGALLTLAALNPLWAADPTDTGSQKAAASEMQMAAETPAVSPATKKKDTGESSAVAVGSEDQAVPSTSEKSGDQAAVSAPIELSNKTVSSTREPLQQGAYDRNCKPMTRKEYKQAYKARMEARTKTTENRLEARQSRWKKGAVQ